jgi:predicted DNA-binding transcriptional regulator AlpA
MDKKAYTIKEFCNMYGIKLPYYFHLQKTGRAPSVLKLGRKVFIPVEAIKEWEEKHLKTL